MVPPYPVTPGDVLAGKYRVEQVLGQGGMGVVVAATHLELQQLVAMKFLIPGGDATPKSRARLFQEARAAVRLRSQHVARVFDVGTLENGAPYIVMEHLQGCDLSSLLERRGPLPFQEAVEYVLQACEAIGEAHQAGIIHRDLKPANLFLTTNVDGSPCVKVLDFGISKLMGSSLALTGPDTAIGSVLYMSPEQVSAQTDLDPRCDIWALGVVLYQLVSGQTPFESGSRHEVTAWVMWAEPKPLESLRSDLPAGLSAVILQCLQKDRERRWPNVAALAAALVPFAPARAAAYAEGVARVLGVQVALVHATAPLAAKDRPTARGAMGSAPDFAAFAQEGAAHAPAISPWEMNHEPQSRDPGGGGEVIQAATTTVWSSPWLGRVVGVALATLIGGGAVAYGRRSPSSPAPGAVAVPATSVPSQQLEADAGPPVPTDSPPAPSFSAATLATVATSAPPRLETTKTPPRPKSTRPADGRATKFE